MNRLVQADVGSAGARAFGLEKAPLTLDESSNNTTCIANIVLGGKHVTDHGRSITLQRRIIRRASSMRLLTESTLGRNRVRNVASRFVTPYSTKRAVVINPSIKSLRI